MPRRQAAHDPVGGSRPDVREQAAALSGVAAILPTKETEMTSRFAALAANVATAFTVNLIDPVTDAPIVDKEGKPAFITIFSTDSEVGRSFDRDERKKATERVAKGRAGDITDQLEQNIEKAAQLTKAWYLVDPETREIIDVPCNADNARELYSEPGMNWLFTQVWVAAASPANFMKRSPKT